MVIIPVFSRTVCGVRQGLPMEAALGQIPTGTGAVIGEVRNPKKILCSKCSSFMAHTELKCTMD